MGDLRSNYSFTSLDSLKKSDLCIVIGSDLRSECPTLNLVIKTQVRDGLLVFGYIGPALDLSYKAKHLGLGVDSVVSLMKGQHPFSVRLKQAKDPCIILGEKFNSGNISQILYKVFDLHCLPNLKKSNISMLRTKSSSVSFSGCGINSLKINKTFDILLLFGVEDLTFYRLMNPNSFIIYIGSHYSVYNLELADLILPASVFIEKDFKVINLENIIKESKSLRQISGDVRSEWFLVLVILSFFIPDFKFSQLKKKVIFDSLFLNDYPFIVKKNFKLSEFDISKAENSIFKKEIFSRSVFNFYEDNLVVRSSKNFKFCLDNLKQSKFKKKNVA